MLPVNSRDWTLSLSDSKVGIISHCNVLLEAFLNAQTKVLILSFIYKGSLYFRVLLGKQRLGWWRKYDQEMRLQHQVVWLFITNADFFFLSLSIIYLFRELETGKQPWRFSSYLNRTVLRSCAQSAVIGNHSYHAPKFQKQYNPVL